MTSVLVIGAGVGGIATAARLARRGYQVTVLEKGERAGGRCDYLVVDGHHFDTGPTLLVMPQVFAQTFAELGERMEDRLDLRRIVGGARGFVAEVADHHQKHNCPYDQSDFDVSAHFRCSQMQPPPSRSGRRSY